MSFNRTILELKRSCFGCVRISVTPSNRTILEFNPSLFPPKKQILFSPLIVK